MRYDSEHKQRTHQRVLKEASREIRAHGYHNVGLTQIMAKAGLTHGGFYAHFKSKEDLLVETIGQMFVEACDHFDSLARDRTPTNGIGAYLDFYLSIRHRDRRDLGCPLPALAADLPQLSVRARGAFGDGLRQLTERLAGQLDRLGRPESIAVATSIFSEMVGAVVLARTLPSRTRSEAILLTTRRSVENKLGL